MYTEHQYIQRIATYNDKSLPYVFNVSYRAIFTVFMTNYRHMISVLTRFKNRIRQF